MIACFDDDEFAEMLLRLIGFGFGDQFPFHPRTTVAQVFPRCEVVLVVGCEPGLIGLPSRSVRPRGASDVCPGGDDVFIPGP